MTTATEPQGGPDRAQILRNVGASLVNAAIPFAIYRLSAPHYPAESVIPLLYATVVPALWLAFNTIRSRAVDAIAIIAICETVATIAVTLLAKNVGWALIARALQGSIVGLVFAFTAMIDRPVMYYISRQFTVGMNPERAEGFERAYKLDKGRTFKIATYVWAIGLIIVSLVSAALAATIDHAAYLLVAPIMSIGANISLVWWTIRFSITRMMRHRDAVMASFQKT
ncbi:MAG: hypothetical protein ISS15_06240 [Alphaproteobacteria bacterium]|nr:hypothetical protein [Alphaproteobacteria bacterium]MBL7097240.1 hypothetical protein [Alphaproteobacteria bacterium]